MLSWLFGGTPSFDLNDKVVIITGASAGIGRSLAEACAAQGSHVVLAARRKAELEDTLKLLSSSSSNNNHLIVVADVSRPEDCKRLVDETVEHYGRIDVLINNAGITQVQRFDEYETLERHHQIMDINYFGTVHCTHHALPHLKQSPTTSMIVTISSMSGKLGVPYKTGYCASKHALHGFMDALRMELQISGDQNVHILLACPGYVRTDIRQLAVGDTDKINNDDIMTVEECTSCIIKAMKSKQREVLVVDSLLAKISPIVKILLPSFADKKIIEKQKGGRT